jgi:D-glycero-D-manno-heptose 1,7-bisphosphate phosphatase
MIEEYRIILNGKKIQTGKKAVFLDRDGVINIDKSYVFKKDQVEFLPGIFDFCRRAIRQGFELVVVTNQSGIGRGYYAEQDFINLMHWMGEVFRAECCQLSCVYYCPFYENSLVPKYTNCSHLRKPQPGMIIKAQNDYLLNLWDCLLVGDQCSDIIAGNKAGISRNYFLAGKYREPKEEYNFRSITDFDQITF